MSCIYGPHQFGTEDQGWVAHFLIRALQPASRSRSTATASRCATCSSSTTWSTPACCAALAQHRPRQRATPSTSAAARRTRSACSSCSTHHRATDRRAAPTLTFEPLAAGRPALLRLRHARSSARATGWPPRVGVARGRRPAGTRWLRRWRGELARRSPRCRRDGWRCMKFALINPPWTLRRQHLLRLPRAAPAARIRLRARRCWSAPGTRC